MSLVVKVGGKNDFIYNNSFAWGMLRNDCPMLEELFPNSFIEGGRRNVLIEEKYSIEYNNYKLKVLCAELNKYLGNSLLVKTLSDLAKGVRKKIVQSMFERKDLEVEVLWK
jgi:hypothetical protein